METGALDSGVTVVIPTLNRGGFLVNCLSDLLNQTYVPLEILVVDQSPNMSQDVARLVERHGDIIRYEQVTFRGLPLARNFGLGNARYDAIVFIDDDIRCDPGFVEAHAVALSRPGVGVVAGRIDVPGETPPVNARVGRYSRWTARCSGGFSSDGVELVDQARGANFAVWRNIALEVGGFDEHLAVGSAMFEDTEFSLRVSRHGYHVVFDGSARLDHLVAPTGGCRVEFPPDRYYSLNHNRSILIRRYSHWYQWPVALSLTAKSVLGATVRNRSLAAGALAAKGARDGWRAGAEIPRISHG